MLTMFLLLFFFSFFRIFFCVWEHAKSSNKKLTTNAREYLECHALLDSFASIKFGKEAMEIDKNLKCLYRR